MKLLLVSLAPLPVLHCRKTDAFIPHRCALSLRPSPSAPFSCPLEERHREMISQGTYILIYLERGPCMSRRTSLRTGEWLPPLSSDRHEGCGSLLERPGTSPSGLHVHGEPGRVDTLAFGPPHHPSSCVLSPVLAFAAPAAHDDARCKLIHDGREGRRHPRYGSEAGHTRSAGLRSLQTRTPPENRLQSLEPVSVVQRDCCCCVQSVQWVDVTHVWI